MKTWKRILAVLLCVSSVAVMAACGTKETATTKTEDNLTITTDGDKTIVTFVDALGGSHEMTLNSEAEMMDYDKNSFVKDGEKMTYTDSSNYTYRLGVDVSEHQGDIDWKQVKDAGYEFAIIRVAYRGYTEGGLSSDAYYEQNIKGALAAGLEVGVYVFSQAINETEAEEEAQLALDNIKKYDITGSVVYDPESILDAESRTDGVTGEQFTKNTIAFCEKVKAAGYTPLVYSNMMWEAYQFDLTQLSAYDFWYADYEDQPQTPYNFTYWQYAEDGSVPGIAGSADLNIQMIPAR
ncbi:MAG: glycoside hydrolase family 25 protein [Hespellia sp.]|nr:glycoside hydrolase family 25 protein [Hespellia sp.]